MPIKRSWACTTKPKATSDVPAVSRGILKQPKIHPCPSPIISLCERMKIYDAICSNQNKLGTSLLVMIILGFLDINPVIILKATIPASSCGIAQEPQGSLRRPQAHLPQNLSCCGVHCDGDWAKGCGKTGRKGFRTVGYVRVCVYYKGVYI